MTKSPGHVLPKEKVMNRVQDTIGIVVCVCVLLNFGVPSFGETAQSHGVRAPLVLISEPVKGGVDEVKLSLWGKSGLISRLQNSGYELETNLFVFTPDEPYYDLDSGVYVLHKYLQQVAVTTKSTLLNVITYGVSGLVLRFGIELGIIQDGLIDNAIMLSTPQRGSFLADFMFQAYNVVKHEHMFEKETRSARFSPFGEVSGVLEVQSVNSAGDLPLFIGTDKFDWESETWWVSKRAREIYEPLYSQYVQERFLMLPYVPVDSPKQTFAGWIQQNRPLLWRNCIEHAKDPPLGCVPMIDFNNLPDKGRDFSTAYYEILAMAVGKNQYVIRTASAGSLAQSLFASDYIPTDIKDAAIHYGLKTLIHFTKKALVTVKAELQKIITDSIIGSIGYLDNVENVILRRLSKEDVLINLGTSVGQRFQRVPANCYLQSMNDHSYSAAACRKTRFINITGRVTNLLSVVWPQVGPNNFFCEVDSSISPQGPRDIIRVFSGFLSPSHLNILKDERVYNSILSFLSDSMKDQEILIKDRQTEQLQVSSWHPLYVAVPWDVSPDQVFDISIRTSSLPEGWRCAIWVEGYDGTRWTPIQGMSEVIRGGSKTDIMLKTKSYRLGLRLIRQGNLNPYTPGGKVESVFEQEIHCDAWAGVEALAPGSGNSGGWQDEGPGIGTGDIPWEPGPDLEIGDDEEFAPGFGGIDDEDIPQVRVVYRSKHTTLWKPDETYHLYWELDFGDGETLIIQGQPHLKVSHKFLAKGTYSVRAISVDNHGDPLIEKNWDVTIDGEEPEVYEFECKSVIPPEVKLDLSGPKKWVVGKQGLFSGKVTWNLPDDAQVTNIECDPGDKFYVIWERSGEFTVFWAVRLTIAYELENKVVRITNTYITSQNVDVLASGIVQ